MFTTAAPITIAPLMNEKVNYDPRRDIMPIAVVAVQPVWLVVNAASPLKSAADIVQKAKETPGKLTYGTSGVGTELHLAAEALSRSAGIQMVHVPFRGGGDVITAVMGQQVDFAALSTASIAGALAPGHAPRARGVVAAAHGGLSRRADLRRDRPRQGHHAAVVGHDGAGRHAAAGRSRGSTQELEKATKDEAVRERMKATFVQIDFAGPQEFARRIETETTFYGDIIRAANIKFWAIDA